MAFFLIIRDPTAESTCGHILQDKTSYKFSIRQHIMIPVYSRVTLLNLLYDFNSVVPKIYNG